jgi:Short C-terminal domain
MTDRIEALERLQRLRDSGALSEDEFQREKASLLGRGDAPPGAPAAEREDYVAHRRGVPLWAWIAGAAALLLAGIASAMLLTRRDRGDAVAVEANRAPPPAEAPTANQSAPAAPPAGIRTHPAAAQLAAAFRAAFGARAVRKVDEADISYRPRRLFWIGDRAVLISDGSNAEECHACAGAVSVHYLAAEGDGFRVTGEWLSVATADYGHPPDWRVTDELTGRPALRVENGGGNQGIFCSFVSYYDLGAPRPAEVARVQTGFTDEGYRGEEEGVALEGQLAHVRAGRSFDVVYSGDESFTETYRFRGGRFVREGRESRVPTC